MQAKSVIVLFLFRRKVGMMLDSNLWQNIGVILKGCAIGLAELRWSRVNGAGFPRNLLEGVAGLFLILPGFMFGLLVLCIVVSAFAGYYIIQGVDWVEGKIRRSR